MMPRQKTRMEARMHWLHEMPEELLVTRTASLLPDQDAVPTAKDASPSLHLLRRRQTGMEGPLPAKNRAADRGGSSRVAVMQSPPAAAKPSEAIEGVCRGDWEGAGWEEAEGERRREAAWQAGIKEG